ncbi:hypothetical protein ACTSKR_12870 [Chitinibacteraceae bacterium HSL-7]
MKQRLEEVLKALYLAFPPRVVEGVITPHECEECAAMRRALAGHTWHELPSAFAQAYADSLPLLSPDAFHAFLPVWLRAAIESPDSEAAAMVAIHLGDAPSMSGFSRAQAEVIIQAMAYVAANNLWGENDQDNIAQLAAVRAHWVYGAS